MYGLKKFKFLYMILVAVLLYGVFGMIVKAYDYEIGASRKYYSPGSDAFIVGDGGQIYDQPYFTGLGYCTGYFYLNHDKFDDTTDSIGLARQVFWYDNSSTNLFLDYLNFKLVAGTTQWHDGSITGPDTYLGKNIYIFNVSPIDQNSVNIPYIYTIGRFGLINKTAVSELTITGHYLSTPALNQSTFLNHDNNTNFYDNADKNYNFTIKYYAQPCVPDMPISSDDRAPINGDADGNYQLARVPAFHGQSANLNAGKPITYGVTQLNNTSNFLPGQRNTSGFDDHITFDNGIFIKGIKEPEPNSEPDRSFYQDYYYSLGVARGTGFSALDSTFVSAPVDTNNQWGINSGTIRVYITFIGIDSTDPDDIGSSCTIAAQSSDLILDDSDYGLSWNRNSLGYSVEITSGTIRNLAKTQCSAQFTSVLEQNIDIKRETVASISWDAYDLSNSMIISQDYNTVSYATPNRITGITGYDFNSWSDDPILTMATDSAPLIAGSTIYNVPINNDNINFTSVDTYAGIDQEEFLIIISGYESSIDKSNSWITSGIPDYQYVFSGSDITKFSHNLHYDRYDYTGFVSLLANGTVTTGMHFDMYFEAKDNVGNTTTQNYSFRTPTWPNAPKPTGLLNPMEQTKKPINTIYIMNNVLDIDSVDGGGVQYDYQSYYSSHQDLIDNFEYISGSSYISTTTDLVLTGINGNAATGTVVTLTGLKFVYNGTSSYITGTPYVSSGGAPMTNYLATDFDIDILATNIYGITGEINYSINVAPSCTESPGCTDPVYVFWGLDLASAQAQRTAALNSGTQYLMNNHRYPHWYAEIKQTGPNFYFTDVAGEPEAKVLYCAGTGAELMIRHDDYMGPLGNNQYSITSQTFTGSTLNIIGSEVKLFNDPNFTADITTNVTANYETKIDNGTEKMTIYVNRPLTGRMFYSICEFTGTALGDFGCPIPGNYTSDVNWTKLDPNDKFVITGWLEGGWLTGSWNGYITGGSVNNGDTVNYWGLADVYNGGGTRIYSKTLTGGASNINSSGEVLFDIENRTGLTATVPYEVYWIDNTPVDATGYISAVLPNLSATVTLSGYNTGVMSTSFESNLIGDDEYIVTDFISATEPSIFENGYGSSIYTGSWYIDGSGSEYKMIHEITFAEDWVGEICVEDRAGNGTCIDVEVTGIGALEDMIITIRPAFRPDYGSSTTGYSIVNGEFWFWVKSGSVWIENYNSAKYPGVNPKINTNSYGTGIVSVMTPSSGAEYLVVFKGSGMLSAGFTGIWTDDITEFNFFSGSYATGNFNDDFVYRYDNGSYIEHYVKVGDTAVSSSGQYDYIGTPDFTAINNNLTRGSPTHPIWYDFDLNNVISSMEQSMVLQGYGSHGFIGWANSSAIIPMTGFVNL